MLEFVILVPSVAALVSNQPTNSYPALALGVGNVPKTALGIKLEVVVVPVPQLESHVIVTVCVVVPCIKKFPVT